MKLKNLIFSLFVLSFSCGFISCKKVEKPKAAQEREEWIASFSDSIARYQHESELASDSIAHIHKKIEDILPSFSHVSNAREVAGYYIASAWKDKLPLTSTGLVARINEDEKLELIACLSKGVFNQIEATAGNSNVFSAKVPHDQALNYRTDNFNRVCFMGSAADSVAQFIFDNLDKKVTITFLNGNKTGSYALPDSEHKLIAETWELYNLKRKAGMLEKEIAFNSRRIDTFRRMMESMDSVH